MYATEVGGPALAPARTFDELAWSGLEELRDGLRAYLVRLCADENDLDDAIQETFLRAARYRRNHRVRNLRPWVMRIAQNVLADGRRRQTRSGMTLKTDEPLDVLVTSPVCVVEGVRIAGGWFEREAARELVRRGLARLRPADHALLEGHYSGGGDFGAAASDGTGAAGADRRLVKIRLYRARRKLRAVVRREANLQRRLGLAS
jgi:DNA-directed RNA polymerase specialized sigma24 family protein